MPSPEPPEPHEARFRLFRAVTPSGFALWPAPPRPSRGIGPQSPIPRHVPGSARADKFRSRMRRYACSARILRVNSTEMRDDRFEWDDRKARANERTHDVTFEVARLAFDDLRSTADLDEDEQDEDRMLLIGLADGQDPLTVCFVERGTRIRIISAWRSTRRERDKYNRENQEEP